jgi:hypothetical protein
MHIVTVGDGEEQADAMRSIMYRINCASVSFFNDKANLVQRSDVNIPATSVASAIHNEYIGGDAPLRVLMPTLGLVAKTDIGGYVTSNKKPFKAIEDVLRRATYGAYKTGSTVYFRDVNSYVISPLEHLFATMDQQEWFEQRATWGSRWQDVFESIHAIISAKTVIDEKSNSGRGGAAKIAAASKGALNIFDVSQGAEAIMHQGQFAPNAFSGSLAENVRRFARGKWGGIQNVRQIDTRRNPLSTDASINTLAENMFQAQVKDGVNYLIKVPIQTGINVTVGKGIYAKLLPPTGDQDSGYNAVGGLMLVADLCHECFFDGRLVQATTSMRGVQGGLSA